MYIKATYERKSYIEILSQSFRNAINDPREKKAQLKHFFITRVPSNNFFPTNNHRLQYDLLVAPEMHNVTFLCPKNKYNGNFLLAVHFLHAAAPRR